MAYKGNKEHLNISVSQDTKDRLQAYIEENHKASISQAITDWIWSQPLKSEKAGTEMEKK
jgi:hypothetical protein